MTPTERSTLIAVFVDRGQADRAIDELRRVGMSYGQIRLVERGAGFFDSLKGWFTGMETTSTITVEDLRRLGVAEQDASFYQSELQAGHCLVLVNARGNLEQALSILHQNGAYDISARLRTTQPTVPVGTQEPGVRPEPPTSTAPPEAPPPPVPAEQQGPPEQSSSARRVPPEAPPPIVPPEPARPE
jgi:hypothetical protein